MSDLNCPDMHVANKLKILALHGYRQNGDVFRQKTGSFRKIVHRWAQFNFITAPHQVINVEDLSKPDEIGQSTDDQQFGWFFNREDHTYRGIRKGGPAIGFEESIKYIEGVFQDYGPFDGVLAFSQGACFLGLLCDMQHRGLLKFNFKFAIFASGFKSDSLPHRMYYQDSINLPTLHIFGENDQIIPTEMSVKLKECFDGPMVVQHNGGHFLPASAAQKHSYQSFFKKMVVLLDKGKSEEVQKGNADKKLMKNGVGEGSGMKSAKGKSVGMGSKKGSGKEEKEVGANIGESLGNKVEKCVDDQNEKSAGDKLEKALDDQLKKTKGEKCNETEKICSKSQESLSNKIEESPENKFEKSPENKSQESSENIIEESEDNSTEEIVGNEIDESLGNQTKESVENNKSSTKNESAGDHISANIESEVRKIEESSVN